MELLENKIFDEIKIGDCASINRILTTRDAELFSTITSKERDENNNIAFCMWVSSLIYTIINIKLPGPGTIYLEQAYKFEFPIILGDSIIVTVTVINKDHKGNRVTLDCKGINQVKKLVISGTATVIAPLKKIKNMTTDLPSLIIMGHRGNWYHRLIALTNGLSPLKTAIVHPVDTLSLVGAISSAKEGLIIPVLVGPKKKIIAAAMEANLDISSYQLISTEHSHEAAEVAVKMARNGQVEALMKGNIHTDELMHAVVNKDAGLRTVRRMSHVFALEVPNYHKPLFITDTAINLFPNLQDKHDIVQNAIDLFIQLGLGIPKVAIISAVETVNEKIPSTLDATALCKMAERGQITNGILDGPLAFDNAISADSARVKGLCSQVAGDADIIVLPDVESGNILYKQMTYLSDMEAAGIVLGARVPIILTSRGSGELSRKASAAMALIYARKNRGVNLDE